MRPNEKCSNKKWLEQKYIVEGLLGEVIAQEAGCCFQTVFMWLRRHEIPVRRTGGHYKQEEPYRDVDWLVEQYVDQRKSGLQIAEEVGVSRTIISQWLKKHGLSRPRGIMKEYHFDVPVWDDKAWLCNRYFEDGMTQAEIAELIGTSTKVVQNRFIKYGIETRTNSETSTGEANGNWRGGTSMLPYPPEWTKSFKRSIRERDRYACAICGAKPSLEVHHIDYVKANTVRENCVTLCHRCHSLTNGHRESWQKRLVKIVEEREGL